ncbi:MAG TPA: hypothetical protein PLL72_00220, partial [Burkholderiaceae bacterium]|nr:hypothetical protein [Burkholderiaceae bacterium]
DRRIIGHLACLGTLPMDDPLPHEPIFTVFASRAGVEMEYMAMAGRLAGGVERGKLVIGPSGP